MTETLTTVGADLQFLLKKYKLIDCPLEDRR